MSLIIGGNESVHTVVDYLCEYGTNNISSRAEEVQKRLKLETKYFSAEVSIHTAQVPLSSSNYLKSSNENNLFDNNSQDATKLQGADAFIFTMNALEAAAVKADGSDVLHALCTIAEEQDVPIRILAIMDNKPLPEGEHHALDWVESGSRLRVYLHRFVEFDGYCR